MQMTRIVELTEEQINSLIGCSGYLKDKLHVGGMYFVVATLPLFPSLVYPSQDRNHISREISLTYHIRVGQEKLGQDLRS